MLGGKGDSAWTLGERLTQIDITQIWNIKLRIFAKLPIFCLFLGLGPLGSRVLWVGFSLWSALSGQHFMLL